MNRLQTRLMRATYLTAVLGMLCLGLAEMNVVYLALITGLSLVGWFREGDHEPSLLGRQVLNGILLAAVAWAFVDFYVMNSGWILTLAHFLLIAQMAKLILPKSDRDVAQIYLISLMTVAVAAIVTVNLAFALAFVLYSGFAIYGLILYHFRTEVKRSSSVYLPEGDRTVRALAEPHADVVVSRRFTWMLVGVIAFAWCFNAVFFVLSPRVRAGFINLAPPALLRTLAGFSDRISLGDIGTILQDDTPVMHVRLWDRDDREVTGEMDVYFRGKTYHYYDGKDWLDVGPNVSALDHLRREPLPINANFIERMSPSRLSRLNWMTQEITLEPIGTRTLFAMPGVLELDCRNLNRLETNLLDDSFQTLTSVNRPMRYTAKSYVSPEGRLMPPWRSLTQGNLGYLKDAYVLLPSAVSTRVRQLGVRVASTARSRRNLDVARTVERYLQENYGYTLTLKPTPDVEPVEDFLFNTKEGHCEYFASAMVVLLRSVKVPARLVSGFHGAEWNETAEWFVVKQSHAHAWVEVHDDESGWFRFDPTPADSRNLHAGGSPMGLVGRWIDYFQTRWLNHVVEFDEEQQSQIVESTRNTTRDIRRHIREVLWSVGAFFKRIWRILTDFKRLTTTEGTLIIVSVFVLSTVLVLTMRWLLLKAARGLKRAFAERRARRLVRAPVAFYEELQKVLKRRGFVRAPAATPREFARQVTAGVTGLAGALDELTDAFYLIRFGGARLTPDEEQRLRDIIDRIRTTPRTRPA